MKYIFTLFLVFIIAFDSYCQKKVDNTMQQNIKTSVSDNLITTDMLISADSARIIGKAIKIGKLIISENLFPNAMSWDMAKLICPLLGNGWRLPTKDELSILYKNKDKIKGFEYNGYWSSTEVDSNYAWSHSFIYGSQGPLFKANSAYVRAVRSL